MHQPTALVVIDPQIGFTASSGAYARARGTDQWAPMRRAVDAIRRFDGQLPTAAPRLWVRSVYRPGQFADAGPMSELCLEGSPETAFDPDLLPAPGVEIVTKHHTDAITAADYRCWLSELVDRAEVQRLTIAGFLLTTCVVETATSTVDALHGTGISIAVPGNLCGARLALHAHDGDRLSRVEEARARLTAAGVDTADVVIPPS